ncbi:PaaI family thioesterase [Selenomonadales bacterium OttesenSCG-928-I06]|nr:PaaI family thioesterase [Selenomonadales bacterium OttesenSCG-928-I06]
MTEELDYDYILKEGILVNEVPEWLKERVIKLYYERNFFVKYLKIKIIDFYEGDVRISMDVRHELTNPSHTLHGGAVASMLDVAMNLACASMKKKVLVLEFNTNFTRSAKEGDLVYALARVIHNGKRTMVVESRITDINGGIMAKARGTFFVRGEFTEEDKQYNDFFEDKYADEVE